MTLYTLIKGGPIDGFVLRGLYGSRDEAIDAGDSVTPDWHVIEIRLPEEPDARLADELERCKRAAVGDSNDEEIEALQSALDIALERWPDVRAAREA